MKLSVNILCLNTFKTLLLSLDILRKDLKFTSYEIIIVDNGSTDELKDFEFESDIFVIRNKENLGISKGKNQGIRASRGEFILLLDGDVVPVPNSSLMMIDWLEQNQDKHAIGFMPNKFAMELNKYQMSHHESVCHTLFNPRISTTACLFYGMYRKEVFDKVMMSEEDEFGLPGYGWEDHDFFNTMKAAGIDQWVAGMNHESGKYYHAINSSIRVMGYQNYIDSSKRRGEYFRRKWEKVHA